MSKKFRDWLFIAFIILFVIITFFVSLYAIGYSLNLNWPPRPGQIFQKTGMLAVDSEPTGSTIFLNNERQRRSFLLDFGRTDIITPTKIKNLAPGEYVLRLEKKGYWPLERKITIISGQTTFAEDFILFKQSLPMNLTVCEPQPISLSPDKKTLILPIDGTAINLKTETSQSLKTASSQEIQWSKNSEQVMLSGQLINLNNDRTSYNFSNLGVEAENFYWDENNKKVYYQTDKGISCLLTDKNTASTILKGGPYIAYAIRGDLIYTVEKISEQTYLRVYEAASALLKSSTNINSGQYSFHQDEFHLNLYEQDRQTLYLLNDYAPRPLARQIKSAKNWQWLNANFLVWHNEFEISSLNTQNGRQELLIRVSDPLTSLVWNRSKNYLIYASENKIQLINLNLEKRMPLTLLTAEQITNLVLDEKNQLLYFYAKIGQQAGVYKLQLQ